MTPITRRRLLAPAGAGGAGLALGGAGGFLVGQGTADASGDGTGSVPFYGEHQAGIDTAAQDRLHFAAFDLVAGVSGAELRELMRDLSRAAAEMTGGEMIGDVNTLQVAPPEDTGETVGLLPSRLTVTFGFGPSLFERRLLGLWRKRPAALKPIPALPGDELNTEESGGDLCVQACSDDPQVAFHAVRNLARIGRGTVVMRWSQLGFGRTASTSRGQETPRNLMGFKDGTANIRAEDTDAMSRFVWAGGEGPAWMRGGSYLVSRRIRMLLEVWDRSALEDQEQTIGRDKYERRGAGRVEGDRSPRPRRRKRRKADDPGRRPRAPRLRVDERRRADPAPRLLLHRRSRREPRRARSRPLLHLLSARPATPVRADPAPARLQRRAGRVHQARRQRRLRCPPRRPRGWLRRRNAARLSGRTGRQPHLDGAVDHRHVALIRLLLSVFVRVP